MKIAGLQKTTLIDYPGKVACTLFLHGCNFRCGFCYNPDLVVKDIEGSFKKEEIIEFLKMRKGKLDAVCITGGEPLLGIDIEFLREIKELGYLIKLDTNGSFPEKLKKVIDEGLVDYVAMDIKASPKKYSQVVGIPQDMDRIEKSIKLLYDFGNYEFRTTVVSKYHDIYEMRALARWLKELIGNPGKYYLQGFKAQTEMICSDFMEEKNVSEKYLQEVKEAVEEYFEEVGIRV